MSKQPDESSWHNQFGELDAAPWPGPRPINEGEEGLRGRNDDADDFVATVLDHLLVVLTADSGVGKSSLLNGKLLPQLDEDGFVPVCIREWHFGDAESPGAFIGRKVRTELQRREDPELAGMPELSAVDTDGFWAKLDAICGTRLVIVLDQFEELVRFQTRLFRDTVDWLVQLNRTRHIRVVISLRAEFHHQLLELERKALPFTMTTFRLKPLERDDDIRAVIDGFDRTVGGIDPIAREQVLGLWSRAKHDSDDPPGLLHLQGLLYALHHRKESNTPILLTKADVDRLVNDAKDAAEPGEETDAFLFGLQEAVRLKLEHCQTAARSVNMDRVLVDGTDAIVHRVVPHLSSGGFKLVLDEWTVAERALAREIARFPPAHRSRIRELYHQAKGVSKESADLQLATAWPDGSPPLGEWTTLGPRVPPAAATSDDVGQADSASYTWSDWVYWGHDISTGPMLGMAASALMYQELRRFSFAMAWLEAASLIRRSVPKKGVTMIALIHDGFGRALERGFGSTDESFAHTMARLTGAFGEQLHWSAKDIEEYRRKQFPKTRARSYLPIINTRWRDCTVRGVGFTDVVFVNCDLRGTRFEDCTFKGATFINCLLDNASFIDCAIEGASGHTMPAGGAGVGRLTRDGDRELPDFRVEVPAGEVALLERYRQLPASGGSVLYSRTSGVAAHPEDGQRKRGITWKPAAGGLAMFGGRLSSLMVRDGKFVDLPIREGSSSGKASLGTLALRHIAGASLDLVEHRSGRIEIVDSTIRGITVTTPPDPEPAEPWTGPGTRASETTIDVVTAVIASTWFGSGLRGSARFRDCVLSQLTNLNDSDRFPIAATQRGEDTLSVGLTSSIAELRDLFKEIKTKKGEAAAPEPAFRVMDYRSQPARLELVKGKGTNADDAT